MSDSEPLIETLRGRNRDLERQVAEQQAEVESARREGDIEAALERVRERTTAMQQSDELREVIVAVYDELRGLGFDARGCALGTRKAAGEKGFTLWWSNEIQKVFLEPYFIAYVDHPYHDHVRSAWGRAPAYHVTHLQGEEHKRYVRLVLENTEMARFPEPVKDWMRKSEHIVLCDAFTEHGILEVAGDEPLPEDKAAILHRFAHVFEQGYRRFLDLEKAEAQAREAKIEASLERVRARAMSLRHSDELKEVIGLIFDELKRLGSELHECNIVIIDPSTHVITHWGSGWDDTALPTSQTIVPWDHPFLNGLLEDFDRGVAYRTDEVSGESLKNYFDVLFSETDFEDAPPEYKEAVLQLERVYVSHAMMNHGALEAASSHPLPPEQADVLRRFARVVDLTYTRFADLMQAEARAREASRQAALDRVRAEIAAMRTVDDLQRITPLIWRELTALDVPFSRCGVFIVDEAAAVVRVYLSTPVGKALAALELGFDEAPLVKAVVDHWRHEAVYTEA